MNEAHETLVLDEDARLLDVVEILREFGVDFLHWQGAPGTYAGPAPTRLVVATARHALAFEAADAAAGQPSDPEARPDRIAIAEASTRTLEGRLRDLGFDFLVRRPVHPLALQLLLQRILDRGEENRVTERVPVGRTVSYRTGLRRRPALLLDLSLRGARLLVPKASRLDAPIAIHLPEEIGAVGPLSIRGRVVRCEEGDAAKPLSFYLGVAFGELSPGDAEALRAVVEAWSEGPPALPPEQAASLPSAAGVRWRPRLQPTRGHRRKAPRKRFRGRVAALRRRDAGIRALVGRNLSSQGMLIEPCPDLAVGDRLCLALCGASGERIVVLAEVARDDGESGLALCFDPPDEKTRRQLAALLDGLPAVERLLEGEPRSVASVVCELRRSV